MKDIINLKLRNEYIWISGDIYDYLFYRTFVGLMGVFKKHPLDLACINSYITYIFG